MFSQTQKGDEQGGRCEGERDHPANEVYFGGGDFPL